METSAPKSGPVPSSDDRRARGSDGKQVFHLRPFEHAWGYAQAVRVGAMLYVSGTVSIDDEGRPRSAGDMVAQVRNVYDDVIATLAAHGATLDHVVREAIVTTDLPRFIAEGLPVRAAAWHGHALPSSAPWIEVPRLAQPEFLVEVEVTAAAT